VLVSFHAYTTDWQSLQLSVYRAVVLFAWNAAVTGFNALCIIDSNLYSVVYRCLLEIPLKLGD
jgi:hypothetical protein